MESARRSPTRFSKWNNWTNHFRTLHCLQINYYGNTCRLGAIVILVCPNLFFIRNNWRNAMRGWDVCLANDHWSLQDRLTVSWGLDGFQLQIPIIFNWYDRTKEGFMKGHSSLMVRIVHSWYFSKITLGARDLKVLPYMYSLKIWTINDCQAWVTLADSRH